MLDEYDKDIRIALFRVIQVHSISLPISARELEDTSLYHIVRTKFSQYEQNLYKHIRVIRRHCAVKIGVFLVRPVDRDITQKVN